MIKLPTKTLRLKDTKKKIIILIGQGGWNKKNYFQHDPLPKMLLGRPVGHPTGRSRGRGAEMIGAVQVWTQSFRMEV